MSIDKSDMIDRDLNTSAFNIRRSVLAMLMLALGLNTAMAVSLGTKYWIDTFAYIQLASGITDPPRMKALFEGPFGLAYQHLMPGLPLFLAAMDRLFGEWTWPAVAVFQYGINAAASVYFARSLRFCLSIGAQFGLVALISLFPFYSAFHGAFLTESISATIFLLIIGATIRGMRGETGFSLTFVILLALAILGGQMRSYLVGTGGFCALLLIYSHHRFRAIGMYLMTVACILSAFLGFSIYKAALGFEFLPPNTNNWALNYASYVVEKPNARSLAAIDQVVLDPAIRDKLALGKENLIDRDMLKINGDLLAQGHSKEEAGRLIALAAKKLGTQSAEVVALRLQLPLASVGFQYLATVGPNDRFMRRGDLTSTKLYDHLRRYYLWNSGFSESDYLQYFEIFTKLAEDRPEFFDQQTIEWNDSRLHRFVKPHPWSLRKGMYFMVAIPSDFLILTGMVGFVFMMRRDWRMMLILPASMALVYVAALSSHIVGDNRHSHFLWPLYLAGIIGLFDCATIRLANFRRLKPLLS